MTTDTVFINGKRWKVHVVKCCREWVVLSRTKIGTCGICGKVPS